MIHHVFANRSNIGDWLSAQGIQSALRAADVTEHLCDDPFVAETLSRLEQLGPRDAIVIGGGGLFMDYFDPFWSGLVEIAARVPTYLWGIGFCDLKREATRPSGDMIQAVLRSVRMTSVRDSLTHQLLAGTGIGIAACPSLLMLEPANLPGKGILHAANYSTAGADVYEAMCAHARQFAASTGRVYRETNNEIRAGDVQQLRQTLALYARSDIIVSSRLHGCLFGLALGRRVIAVSGDRKVEAFMDAAGLGEWVCTQEGVDGLPRILDRIDRQVTPRAFLAQARRQNLELAERVRADYMSQPVA